MRRITVKLLAMCCTLGLCLCGAAQGLADAGAQATRIPAEQAGYAAEITTDAAWNDGVFTFTDDLGKPVSVTSFERVAVCSGSFAEVWTLAGGTLTAVTNDAYDQHGLELGDDVVDLGSIKTPSVELLLESAPDFVVMSANVAGDVDIDETLALAGIPHAYFDVETFDEYLHMLRVLTLMTGREELYEQNGAAIAGDIQSIIAETADMEPCRVLLIRAYSSGAKAKGADNMTGEMLKDLGCVNIADENPSLLEDMSMEKILEEDPDYIFVTTMGSDEEALAAFEQSYTSNPAWAALTAVQQGRFNVLPKELFHLKPNSRWAESYRMLADILLGRAE